MFSSSSFAPLYAEQYFDVGADQRQMRVDMAPATNQQRASSTADNPGSPYSSSWYEYGMSHNNKPPSPRSPQSQSSRASSTRYQYQGENINGSNKIKIKAADNSESPPSTETSSTVDENQFPVEDTFEDEPYLRRLSSSGYSSFRQRSLSMNSNNSYSGSRRVSSSSNSNSSRQELIQATSQEDNASTSELVKRDRQIGTLMKQLDSMQRRVVDLEVDLQCQDMRFAKHTEDVDTLQKVEGGKTDSPVGIEVGGPVNTNTSGSSSTSSDEEKQQGKPKKSIGPEAKRMIHKLLNDYEDMERLYKEEKYRHARDMRNMPSRKSGRSTAGSAVGTDVVVSQVSSSQMDPAWDTEVGRGIFKSKMQQDQRLSHITTPPFQRNLSALSGTAEGASLAPDPPEMEQKYYAQEPHFVHPKYRSFPAKANCGEDDDESDRHSDDLSSRYVNSLIDDDAKSDCNAVKDHQGEGRQYWRDIILGVNDGLVSTFLLVAGVRGGGMSSRDILLTAIAGSVAGAVSMCAGEYVATKSQNEVIAGEIALEEKHIRDYRRDELTEVSDLLELIGIGQDDRALQKKLIRHYARDPKALLKIMIALELGFLEEEERSPLMAGFVSFFLFLIGAVPSVIPFMVPDIDPTVGFIAAGIATCITLLIVGAVKTWATKGNCLTAALENLAVAGVGGAVAYGAGVLSNYIMEE